MRKMNSGNLLFTTSLLDKMKGRSNRTIMILIAAWLIMLAMLVPCNAGSSQATQTPLSTTILLAETSSLNGATLLDRRCSDSPWANLYMNQ